MKVINILLLRAQWRAVPHIYDLFKYNKMPGRICVRRLIYLLVVDRSKTIHNQLQLLFSQPPSLRFAHSHQTNRCIKAFLANLCTRERIKGMQMNKT